MHTAQQSSIWSKNFITVALINFMVMLIYYLLLVTIGIYVVEQFAGSTRIAGLVTGMMVIGCLIGRFLTGFYIERLGAKRVLYVGAVALTLTMALYLLAFSIPLLILIRLLSGIAVGIIGTVTGTIVAFVVPPNRRGEGISYFSLSTILAAAIGPFLGLLLVQHIPYYLLFIMGIAIGMLTLLLALLLKINTFNLPKSQRRKNWLHLSNFIEPKAINISLVVMLVGTGYAAIQAYLSFYAKSYDLITAASFFFVVYAAVILVSRPFTGRLLDIRGENIIVYPSLLLLVMGFLLLSEADSALLLLSASALIGLGFGNFQSAAQAIAVKLSPINKIGQATSTYFILFDLGIGIGPYLLGFVIPWIGYRGMYLICALISALSIILYYFLHANRKITPQIKRLQ